MTLCMETIPEQCLMTVIVLISWPCRGTVMMVFTLDIFLHQNSATTSIPCTALVSQCCSTVAISYKVLSLIVPHFERAKLIYRSLYKSVRLFKALFIGESLKQGPAFAC